MPRALFMVNGLGLGNSTRCYAIIQELTRRGVSVEVITSGNGTWFFKDKPEVGRIDEIPALQYGKKDGRISVVRTLGAVGKMIGSLRAAEAVVASAIDRFRPDFVVADSSYSFRPVKRAGIPLAALNNSDMVVRGVRNLGNCPRSVLPQYTFVEFPDYLYHRRVPDLVVSPRLDPKDRVEAGPFRAVGPIVRHECEPTAVSNQPPSRVVIMLSGSAFGSQVNLAKEFPGITIDVMGRDGSLPGVNFHGRVRDSLPLLRQADLVVVNGGFSAVSEAVFLRKPTIVIPVPRHAEQWANGRTVEVLNLGMSADEDDLEGAIARGLADIEKYRAGYRALATVRNGAEDAADLLLGLGARR